MDQETVINYFRKPANVPDESKRQTHAVGVAMSSVRASAEWKVYADHLQALVEAGMDKARRLEGELLDGPIAVTTEYYEQKRQLAIAKATVAAYTMAIQMVDMLVERGLDAAKDIVSLQISGQ